MNLRCEFFGVRVFAEGTEEEEEEEKGGGGYCVSFVERKKLYFDYVLKKCNPFDWLYR